MRAAERRSQVLAKRLRRRMTDAEIILWSRLRHDSVHAKRFRRQHPIGPYIADFACVPARLIVEDLPRKHGGGNMHVHFFSASMRRCGPPQTDQPVKAPVPLTRWAEDRRSFRCRNERPENSPTNDPAPSRLCVSDSG